jgi:3-hydroxyacyl-CoA dehydrogenase
MARQIKRVAVLGSGVMGTGIAAHLAGCGIETLLLDIVPRELTPDEAKRGLTLKDKVVRDRLAQGALDAAAKQKKPPIFYHPNDRDLITVGNLEDDLARTAQCDWVIEVVIENLKIKQSLFAKLDEVRRPGTIVTSNTSGLRIADMVSGRSEDFARHFFVTHFFNPVRFMRLLELVPGEKTDPALFQELARFGADRLGKGVVFGKDTPNFVANRIGTYGMMYALHAIERQGLTVEEIDAAFGPVSGRPKSAMFRTADIVGLDTLAHVANNCYEVLTKDSARDTFKLPAFVKAMLERKMLGDKTQGGFYKKVGQEIHALNLKTFEYKPKQKVRADSIGAARGIEDTGQRIKRFLAGTDSLAKIAWEVNARSLIYSAQLLGEIADDLVNIDNALKWGFNWELGPFETWDAIGVKSSIARMRDEGYDVPTWVLELVQAGNETFYGGSVSKPTFYDPKTKTYKEARIDSRAIRIAVLKDREDVIKNNGGATLYDIGDGALLLEFRTKMNAVDDDVISMIHDSVTYAESQGSSGLVIGNEHPTAFSAGANIFAVLMAANQGQWEPLSKMIDAFQQANMRLRYSDIPTCAAPAGLALGGGAEIVLGADVVRAQAELYMGLVEVGVGLIPAGGGCLQMLYRFCGDLPDDSGFDPLPFVRRAFENIGMAKVSVGAEDARRLGMLRAHDTVTLNKDLLLHDAKQCVLGLSRAGYRPPRRKTFRLPGESGTTTIRWFIDNMRQGGYVTDHDYLIAGKLGHVLCGGETNTRLQRTEQQILDLEREVFLSLCGEQKTRDRMQHMLTNGKPLRN